MNEESSAPPALRAGQWEKERIVVPEEEGSVSELAALVAASKPIGPLDLLIAGQARSLGATLVTGKAGEFEQVKGLKALAGKMIYMI